MTAQTNTATRQTGASGTSRWTLWMLCLLVSLALSAAASADPSKRACAAAPHAFSTGRSDQCEATAAASSDLPLSRAFPHLHQLLLAASSHAPAVSIASAESPSCPRPSDMQLVPGSVVAAPARFAEAIQPARPRPWDSSLAPPRFELIERIHVIGHEPGATATHTYQISARKEKDERADSRGSIDTRSQAMQDSEDDEAHSSFADSIFSADSFFHTLLPEWHSTVDEDAGAVAAPLLTTIDGSSAAMPSAGALDSHASSSAFAASSSPPPSLEHGHSEWELRDRVGRGHYGELWRAHRLNAHGAHDSARSYVLKRLFVEKGYRTRLSGVREVHFGLKIAALPAASRRHLTRLVEWFEDPLDGALWLVFVDEGISLAHYLTHTASAGEGATTSIVTPSEQWTRMKLQTGTPRFERPQQQPREDFPIDSAALQLRTETVPISDALECPTAPPSDTDAHQAGMFGPFLPSPPPSTISFPECPVVDDAPLIASADQPSMLPSPAVSSPTRRPRSRDWLNDDFKSISFQLLQALAVLHEQGITHRDVKPANLLVRPRSSFPRTVRVDARWSSSPRLHVRLCDFGSSLDADPSLAALLYPPPRYAPSRLENTQRYSPPEVLFASSDRVAFSALHPQAYDLWSAGVLMLEMIVGSADNVFRIDARVKARIEARVEEAAHAERRAQQRARQESHDDDESDDGSSTFNSDAVWQQALARRKEKAVLFRALVEYCVAPLPSGDDSTASGETCSDEAFQRLLQRVDPLGIGAPSMLSVQLIRRLLQWHPSARGSAADALAHPFFTGDHAAWSDRSSADDATSGRQSRDGEEDDSTDV